MQSPFLGPALSAAALGALLLTTGCGTDPRSSAPPPAGVEVRDSLGVTIVEVRSLEDPGPSGLEVAWSDTVRFGRTGDAEADPEYLFGAVMGVIRLSDGTVVVADRQAYALRMFAPDGTHLRTVGGSGDGPGEFAGIQGLRRLPGDSIFVLDRGTRWSLFDPGGRFVTSGYFGLSNWASDIYPDIEGVFADGSFFIRHRFYRETVRDDDLVVSVPHWRAYRSERTGDPLVHFDTIFGPANVQIVEPPPASGGGMPSMPMMLQPQSGLFDLVHGDHVYRVDDHMREIRVIRSDGTLERIIRFKLEAGGQDGPPAPADPEAAERVRRADEVRTRFERAFPELATQVVGTSPFSGLTVDELGNLWLRQGPAGARDGMARWLVLDPEGVPRHSVDLPAHWTARGHRGMTISADAITTDERDALMVQTIIVAPLRRR
jgi:hypothetical protein